ncbi:DNA-binding PadR family transcriptional regulator [Actinokineospora baliensis]|uniref:PadR family transcriptional regulator n=1 Tax=Actinokineospora baliensis TaxID=547056 RepID=UPI001EF87F85|nr:PadR family transcriptional regulator [Actinokineospora baliensis]MBM7771559.1 DNA-binding PadR family transcriptional regulator [Actinokineospora baliensis]
MDVVREFANGALRLRVLRYAANEEVHGALLTEELAARGHRVSPGTLYPLLHRLQEAGLLKSRTEVVGGRRVRRYRTTKRGKKVLADCKAVLAELADDVA